MQTNKGYDPFSLLSSRVSSKHIEMMMKLRKLHYARGNQQNGTCLLYISLVLVTLSNDVELNPGPRTPKYPCGSCGAAVKHNQNSIQCDGCGFWHHIECQGMNASIYQIMAEHTSYSWTCLKCGLPNFGTTLFDDFSASYCSSNSFSVLEASSLSPKTSTPSKKEKNISKTEQT